MGVIRVNVEAMKQGYTMGDPNWSNLGQGQPEVGRIEGAPPRIDRIDLEPGDHAYGPVEGVWELRERVAEHYNRLYRKGKATQYTAENVALAAGGRLALSRIGATLEDIRLGYFTPDYTAYEDLMTTFQRINPYWFELRPENGFRIDPEELERRVSQEKVGALLISNPCNPTGVAIHGEELKAWAEMARRQNCTLLMDEFYSHFMYNGYGPVSIAPFVEDIEEDPILIVDGLTKCYRYPGWRVGWVLGPKKVIQCMSAAGSFLDGGMGRPIQRAALQVLEPANADQETEALRNVFGEKQRITIERLEAMGVMFPHRQEATFYTFGSVANLPESLNTGEKFMQAGIKHRVLTVPGEYFDVNPHRTRTQSDLEPYVRFSFGPPKDNLVAGLDRLEEMVRNAR